MTSSLSPQAVTRRFLLGVFLACQFFGLSRTFFMGLVGDGFNQIAAFLAYGSLLLLPVLLVFYRNTSRPGEGIGSFGSAWVAVMAAASTASLLYGIARGYYVREAIQDYAPYVILGSFVLIGARRGFWEDLVALLPWLLGGALVINTIGLAGIGDLIEKDIGERVGRESVGYRTQAVLGFWGMALFLMRRRSFAFKFTAVAALLFYLLQQVLFQKRLGTSETLIYLGGFFILIPILANYRNQQDRVEDAKLFLGLLTAATAAAVVSVILGADLLLAQAQALYQRFIGAGTGQSREQLGLVATLFTENERYALAWQMFDDFNAWDTLFGRGMGGHFTIQVTLNANDEVRAQQYLSMYLDDIGAFGRRGIEVGWLMPFMKGGLMLMGVMLAGVAAGLARLRFLRDDPFTMAAWAWLFIELLYLTQGGGFVVSTSYRVILLGACLGRCMAPFAAR